MKTHSSVVVVFLSAAIGLTLAGCMNQPGNHPSAVCRTLDENGHPIPSSFTGTLGATNRGHAANHVVVVQSAEPGCCAEFDRVVFQFEGIRLPSYKIQYVNPPIQQCASGQTVNVAGNAHLQISMDVAQAHTEAGQPTIANRDQRLNCPNLKQLVEICDFEGKVQFVAGLDSKKPYRAVELQNPPRLVIDVKH